MFIKYLQKRIIMNKIYHYTSKQKWEKALEAGVLRPLSPPFQFENLTVNDIPLSDKVRNIIIHTHYVVGLPEPYHKGWIDYGLMEELRSHTSGEILLEIPILNCEDAFVREHKHFSPRGLVEFYGSDSAYRAHKAGIPLSQKDLYIIIHAYERYLDSTTRLDDYRKDFVVPEIWLPQKTPTRLIRKV